MNKKLPHGAYLVLRLMLSVVLGLMSVTDKHHALYYLSAPTLAAAAQRIGLSPTGVLLGQLAALLNPTARPILPPLLIIWLIPLAFPARLRFRRQLSPAMLFLLLTLWEAGRFLFLRDGGALFVGISGAVLSSCALYFIIFLKSGERESGKAYAAALLLSFFALMLGDSRMADGALTLFAALIIILLWSTGRLWASVLSGVAISLAAVMMSKSLTALPMLLSAVAAAATMQKWGKRVYTAALMLCCLLALLPAGVFLEHPLWLMCAPAAGGIFLLLPLQKRVIQPAAQPLGVQYEALVQQVDKLQHSARGRISFYPEIAARATQLLRQAGALKVSVTCAKDLLGGFFLDVSYESGELSEAALLGLMERAAGFSLTARRCFIRADGSCACFVRRAPYTVQCAALCKTKAGETVCGDNALAFSADQSHYVLLLSDGMGSGKDAFAQSCWTLTLLQKLLRAGLRAEGALGMVHSSLRLANEEIAFATADLCSIDLHSGKARFVKAGALSSFILRGEEIIEISAVSMPLGATESPDVASTAHTLKEGDLILLISDGAYEQKDHLLFTLQKYRSLPIDTLARRLMSAALPEREASDDVTVLVARFCKNT